ncbi:hypothetical protein [Dyella psychrodurans]|uniref:Uncharacterized protein n=1 Tax=Dyella psychrodurans TaxID=1927960 RepID=A0A370WV68_9GAMM|nr:hypothetical protein [Dyella psychrodurans]RDS80022.1 hypothetical protein DWU99_20420 [Dyella psychrodurans]
METGPFAVGEVQSVSLLNSPVGSFYLHDDAVVMKIRLINPFQVDKPVDLIVSTGGASAFQIATISTHPAKQVAIQILKRQLEITLGSMIGNADPITGDLGVGTDGELVVSVWVEHGNYRIVSLGTGMEVREKAVSNYVWFRHWKLEAVASDRSRRFVLVERTEVANQHAAVA